MSKEPAVEKEVELSGKSTFSVILNALFSTNLANRQNAAKIIGSLATDHAGLAKLEDGHVLATIIDQLDNPRESFQDGAVRAIVALGYSELGAAHLGESRINMFAENMRVATNEVSRAGNAKALAAVALGGPSAKLLNGSHVQALAAGLADESDDVKMAAIKGLYNVARTERAEILLGDEVEVAARQLVANVGVPKPVRRAAVEAIARIRFNHKQAEMPEV